MIFQSLVSFLILSFLSIPQALAVKRQECEVQLGTSDVVKIHQSLSHHRQMWQMIGREDTMNFYVLKDGTFGFLNRNLRWHINFPSRLNRFYGNLAFFSKRQGLMIKRVSHRAFLTMETRISMAPKGNLTLAIIPQSLLLDWKKGLLFIPQGPPPVKDLLPLSLSPFLIRKKHTVNWYEKPLWIKSVLAEKNSHSEAWLGMKCLKPKDGAGNVSLPSESSVVIKSGQVHDMLGLVFADRYEKFVRDKLPLRTQQDISAYFDHLSVAACAAMTVMEDLNCQDRECMPKDYGKKTLRSRDAKRIVEQFPTVIRHDDGGHFKVAKEVLQRMKKVCLAG